MSDDEEGITFSYNSDLDAFDLYHLVQEGARGRSAGGGPILPALGHAVAGAIASAIAKGTVYPIDTVTTRLQVQKQFKGKKEAPSAASDGDAEYRSLPDAIRKIYKNEGGISAFYSGCLTEITKGIVDSFCFFLAYTAVRDQMVKSAGTKRLPIHQELSVGVIAGCFSKAITSPIQNVVTRQQTAALIAARNPSDTAGGEGNSSLSIKDIIRQIREEKGIAGFWSGYGAAVILTINPAITFAAENALKRFIPKSRRENPGAAQTFLLAALSKVIATSVTYPISMAKSRAMASGGGRAASPHAESKASPKAVARRTVRAVLSLIQSYATLFRSLRDIFRAEGVAGLYSGLEGDILKGFLQHGLTMMVKENVHGNVVHLYYVLLKLTRRWPAVSSSEQLGKAAQENAGAAIKEGLAQASTVGETISDGAKDLAMKVVGN